jgi:tRNA-(ms[2]io[6]A)-hydroxylase
MLGLTAPTDPRWAQLAADHLDVVLIDHAHCELKAAANAISLVARNPDDMPLVRALSALAEEEVAHFRQVLAMLEERGLTLGTPSKDEYAILLRRAATQLPSRHDEQLVWADRLLVGALIEARSAERFQLLARELEARGAHDLPAFYNELFACEARHYRTYVDLAELAVSRRGKGDARAIVKDRLAELAKLEGQVVLEGAAAMRAAIHG